MKERPILFSGPMVRAILDCSKTQTRRIIKPQPSSSHWERLNGYKLLQNMMEVAGGDYCLRHQHTVIGIKDNTFRDDPRYFLCPYGKPGDRLWVREHWGYHGMSTRWGGGRPEENHATVKYHADGVIRKIPFASSEEMHEATPDQNLKYPSNWEDMDPEEQDYVKDDLLNAWWKRKRSIPSIHMYRWASRIDLEVTRVKVERLQDISEDDAFAEGIDEDGEVFGIAQNILDNQIQGSTHDIPDSSPAKAEFRHLWNSINGNWDDNPWVWVVSFKKL